MRYIVSRTEDAHLGLALMAAVACGLAACWGSFMITIRFLFASGLVKIHILYPAQSKMEGGATIYGCLGLAILFGIFVTHLVFRAVNRWLNSA
jgi:hypothetical protein